MVWTSLIVVTIFLLIYLPAMFQNIRIGIDTHFDKEIFLSIGLFIFGLFTVYSIVKSLMKSKP
jgi:small basic protein